MSGDAQKSPPVQAGSQPGEKIDFDDYSANYNELLHESTKLYAQDAEYFAKYKVDLVRQSTRSPVKRVLEYGCGTGRNIGYLQAAFPNAKIFGTDVSAESLHVARGNNPDSEFALEAPGLDIGRFDLIFIPPVERESVMKSLATRLSPGGAIDVFEHNPFNPVTRKIVNDCPFDADAVLLKPAELCGLFRHAEIRLDHVSYCLFVPPRLSWLIPVEKYLRWLPLGGQYWIRGMGS
jgi:SAM-dependent methyltransferase